LPIANGTTEPDISSISKTIPIRCTTLSNRLEPPHPTRYPSIRKAPKSFNLIGSPLIFCRFWITSPFTNILTCRPAPRNFYFIISSSSQYQLSSHQVIQNRSGLSRGTRHLIGNMQPHTHACQTLRHHRKSFSTVLQDFPFFSNIQNMNGICRFCELNGYLVESRLFFPRPSGLYPLQ
jgi:hypothetical protein